MHGMKQSAADIGNIRVLILSLIEASKMVDLVETFTPRPHPGIYLALALNDHLG